MRAIAILLAATLVGCAEKTDPTTLSPVGSWGQWNAENDGGDPDTSAEFDYTYVFSEDGTYTVNVGGNATEGTWTKDGATVTLDSGATITMDGADKMQGTTPSGTRVVLHKM